MSRIWAVARHMIAEAIRTRIAVVFILAMAAILLTVPFMVAGDGATLKSRIQSHLAYSLGSVSFLLSLLTVFISCSTLSNEVRLRQIFMIACKPIPRWQFFAGKWLGIAALNAGLLLTAGAMIYAGTWYLRTRPTYEADRAAINAEVFTVRFGCKVDDPNFDAMVEERIRKLREDGRLKDTQLNTRLSINDEIRSELTTAWRTLKPGEVKDYQFSGLLVDRDAPNTWVHLHFKPQSSAGVDDVMFRARFQCGDRSDMDTLMPVQEGEFIVNRFHDVPVPAIAVNKNGTLHLRIQNITDHDTIVFEGNDSFELLYGIGTFHWNLFRALSITWCRLAFLGTLGLAASTFLSFPVAVMVTMLILFVATTSGFLTEAIGGAVPTGGVDPMWILGPVLRPVATIFVGLVPDFSKYDPAGTVVAGRVVPLMWVMLSLVKLVLIQGLALGLLGAAVFTKRELAQVTV